MRTPTTFETREIVRLLKELQSTLDDPKDKDDFIHIGKNSIFVKELKKIMKALDN